MMQIASILLQNRSNLSDQGERIEMDLQPKGKRKIKIFLPVPLSIHANLIHTVRQEVKG